MTTRDARAEPAAWPTDAELADCLARAIGSSAHRVDVVTRSPLEEGTAPKEVVTCSTPEGVRRLLCKYADADDASARPGRGGIRFEAAVYRAIVRPAGISAPACLGLVPVSGRREALVLEHLDDAIRISEAAPSATIAAARWLGAFHRRWDYANPDGIALPAHDAALVRMWADRAQAFTADRTRSQALRDACATISASGTRFTVEERTVIHGEFTVHNVLTRDDEIIPVDWESAARGLGEIDLAMLLERWDEAIQHSCVDAYVDSRWPAPRGPAAAEFAARLAWARAYVSLRWLADRESSSTRPELAWRFDDLVEHAKELVVR
jgi:hypothetical protein